MNNKNKNILKYLTTFSLSSHCTLTLLDLSFSTPRIIPHFSGLDKFLHRPPIRKPLSTPPSKAKAGQI